MRYKLLGSDFENFLFSSKENTFLYKIPTGHIGFEQQQLGEGLLMLEAKYQMTDDVSIFGRGEQALLEIQLNLSETDIHFKNRFKNKVAKAAFGNIAFLSPEDNHADIQFQKDALYQTFDVHIPQELLTKYAGESKTMDAFINNIHKGRSSVLAAEGVAIQAGLVRTLHDIRNCKFEGLTRRIYLESKVYELIALLNAGVSTNKPAIKLKKADLDRIHQAAHLIKENLENPLTIPELAKQVGINQTKLKECFKEVFNNTIFGYLQQIRMNEARNYLYNTNLTVQEIGNLLGYQHMSNFSAAFKKVYGISPLKIKG